MKLFDVLIKVKQTEEEENGVAGQVNIIVPVVDWAR